MLKTTRLLVLLLPLSAYLFWGFSQYFSSPLPDEQYPIKIFASQADDSLCDLYNAAIKEASDSIFLSIYTFKHPLLQKNLSKKADEGVSLKIFYDKASKKEMKESFKDKASLEEAKTKGLMHQKILIVDKTKVYIGSANWTEESLHVDDNLVLGFFNKELAKAVLDNISFLSKNLSYYPIPEYSEEAFLALKNLIINAKKKIHCALFNLTHPELTNELINAKKRGVEILVVLDRNSSKGACKESAKALIEGGVPCFVSSGKELFHHKFALIDEETLVMGSANWTKAAFKKNHECLLIVSLGRNELKKVKKLEHAIVCTKDLLPN